MDSDFHRFPRKEPEEGSPPRFGFEEVEVVENEHLYGWVQSKNQDDGDEYWCVSNDRKESSDGIGEVLCGKKTVCSMPCANLLFLEKDVLGQVCRHLSQPKPVLESPIQKANWAFFKTFKTLRDSKRAKRLVEKAAPKVGGSLGGAYE